MTPLVFLHGWGQSARIWHAQREAFPDALYLNLPGHGGAADADDWLEALAGQLPGEPAILVGWSLGGMLAMQLALKDPDRVAGLALVSTTPCFRNKDTWTHGCSDAVFEGFVDGVAKQSAKTLGRFFALMLHGDNVDRRGFNELARQSIDREQPPSHEGLRRGLELLAGLDLRDALAGIRQPALVLHGNEDAIVPATAGRFLAGQLPNAEWRSWPAGHAPFLTHGKEFNQQLEEWCRNISIAAW